MKRNEMVERLAKAYAEWLVDDHTPGYEAPARFFLNVIADELWHKAAEIEADKSKPITRLVGAHWHEGIGSWLREQAKDST